MEFHTPIHELYSYTPEIQLTILSMHVVAIEKHSHYNHLEQYYLNIQGPRGACSESETILFVTAFKLCYCSQPNDLLSNWIGGLCTW